MPFRTIVLPSEISCPVHPVWTAANIKIHHIRQKWEAVSEQLAGSLKMHDFPTAAVNIIPDIHRPNKAHLTAPAERNPSAVKKIPTLHHFAATVLNFPHSKSKMRHLLQRLAGRNAVAWMAVPAMATAVQFLPTPAAVPVQWFFGQFLPINQSFPVTCPLLLLCINPNVGLATALPATPANSHIRAIRFPVQ